MSALKLQPSNSASNPPITTQSSRVNTELRHLSTRLTALEARIPTAVADHSSRIASIEKDLESSLLVSEKKVKELDELYRQANAENEALYERFNGELGKVLKGLKGGQGIEEMRTKLKKAQDEAAALRRENARLKRERISLKSQLGFTGGKGE